MKAALATCEDIFLPRAANSGGPQRASLWPECAPSCRAESLAIILRYYITAECSSLYAALDCAVTGIGSVNLWQYKL